MCKKYHKEMCVVCDDAIGLILMYAISNLVAYIQIELMVLLQTSHISVMMCKYM